MKVWDRLPAGRETEEGFTLIELLIVMSVMLILMTLAVPQMLKLTKQAHETSAIQSVRTIGQRSCNTTRLIRHSVLPAGFRCWGAIQNQVLRVLSRPNFYRPTLPADRRRGTPLRSPTAPR